MRKKKGKEGDLDCVRGKENRKDQRQRVSNMHEMIVTSSR